MDGFAAVDFELARQILQRGTAALYLIAFVSSLNQFRPLLGERGLLPAPDLLAWAASSDRARRMLRPTVFRWIRYTDRRLVALCVAGILLSTLLVAGVPQLGPPWLPMLCFLAIWFGYMSIVSLGQTFYGFGWEMLLLEMGFLAAFLGSNDQPPPTAIIVLCWWLVFRLEFGAGMIKIRGGSEWRDLTAMTYHHETQPMPGPLSRQAHLLPRWFHKAEVIGNHVAQLGVPWLLFAPALGLLVPDAIPQAIGAGAAIVVILTQLWLVATGNFAWLNWSAIVLAASAIAFPWAPAESAEQPAWWIIVTSVVAVGYAALSWPAARNLASRRQLMNASFNRWNLGNTYGAFGTVTRVRLEVVMEATEDADPHTARWVEYEFKGKPGDPRRLPPQVAPYHLRLDWLMWFLALGRIEDWFETFLVRLLEADRPTLRLLRRDPFDGRRPRWIRATMYRYRFATREEHRRDGARWVREERYRLVRPMALAD